jgi:branched-chain amino acid transport system substrate-binding protein
MFLGMGKMLGSITMGVAVSLVAAACGSGSSTATASQNSAQTINVGVIISLTGPVSFAGVPEENAIKLAVSQINAAHLLGSGRTLSAHYLDDQSTAEQAGAAVRSASANSNNLAILGPTISGNAEVMAPIAQQNKIPMLGVSANSGAIVTAPGNYVFTTPVPAQQEGQGLASLMAQKLHYKRIFAVYARDFAGEVVNATSVINPLKTMGASVDVSTVLTANTDYAPVITQLKQYGPDAIYMGLNGPQAGSFMQQAASLGVHIPAFGMPPTETSQLISNGGSAVEGMIFPADYNPDLSTSLNKTFVSDYTKKYGSAPDDYAALGYSSAEILAQAISKISGTVTRSKIQKSLSTTRQYDVVVGSGTASFAAQRFGNYSVEYITVKNGKFVPYTG